VRHQWQKLNRFTLTPQVAPAYYGASVVIGF
jgi:hypothetical protein